MRSKQCVYYNLTLGMACQLDNIDTDHELATDKFKVKINLMFIIRLFPVIVIDEDVVHVTRNMSRSMNDDVLSIVNIF